MKLLAAEIHVVELVASGRDDDLVAELEVVVPEIVVRTCRRSVAAFRGTEVYVGITADGDVPRDGVRPEGVGDDALQDRLAA